MRKLLVAGALLLTSSSAIAQQSKWVLWYEAATLTDEGKVFSVHWEPVLETNILLDCNNARDASLAAEEKRWNAKRVGDVVVVKVEGTKLGIFKRFPYCYMYGYDPGLKR